MAGAFVFSAGIGLVATNWLQAFSYGYDRLRFIKPVFIGDTIYTIRTNLAKEPKYQERGLTRAKYEVFKGEGELVLYCEHLQTVLYRDPAKRRAAPAPEGGPPCSSESDCAAWPGITRARAIRSRRSRRAGRSAADMSVHWDARPLKDFEDQPLEELATTTTSCSSTIRSWASRRLRA